MHLRSWLTPENIDISLKYSCVESHQTDYCATAVSTPAKRRAHHLDHTALKTLLASSVDQTRGLTDLGHHYSTPNRFCLTVYLLFMCEKDSFPEDFVGVESAALYIQEKLVDPSDL